MSSADPPSRLLDGGAVGLTTATARLLLAPFEGGGRADVTARRLGQAIRLGLLIDGERLPAEPQLAAAMGVSTVTLRDALGTLRQQGLVVTRRGRGGGTFVRAPSDGREPLRQFGIHELQELGDQRAAISGAAARLAAERATDQEIEQLREQVQRLAAGGTVSERRRAETQLCIGIAAAAQSSRLAREEARLRAELGDLFGLTVADQDQRRLHDRRRELVEAIAARDAAAARELAERQVAEETEALIALRLELERRTSAQPWERALGDLCAELAGVVAELNRLAAEFIDLCAVRTSPRAEELSMLRPAISGLLASHEDLVSGAGVIVAPGLLQDADRWLQWWSRPAPGAQPEFLRVNLDPAAPDFLDYTNAEWFSGPQERAGAYLCGPYVDFACTNMYAITLSVPAKHRGRFCGVAAADVLVTSIERRLLPALAGLERPIALVSGDGRVVLSSDAGILAGSQLVRGPGSPVAEAPQPPLDCLRVIDL